MNKIHIAGMIFILVVVTGSDVLSMQSFSFSLPELQGPRKLPEDELVKKKIGVFKNVSTLRIEIKGFASIGEEKVPSHNGETITVTPRANFGIYPTCVPSYEPLPLEPNSNIRFPAGPFHINYFFIKSKKDMPFLAEGDGGFTLSMHLINKSMNWYPQKAERIREPSVTITEATIVVEADDRIGDVNPRKDDTFRLPVIFSGGHINFAWGYKDDGFLIDADGKVFLYDNRCRGPLHLNGDEPLTDDLIRTFFTMTKFVKTIGTEEFAKMKELISMAAQGVISRRGTAKDAGSSGFFAFAYDNQNKTYQRVNLDSTGDFEIKNDSISANMLKEWLSKLKKEVMPQVKPRK